MNDCNSIDELKAAALDEAKKAANGSTGLSRALNGLATDRKRELSPQAVSQWKQVPAERVLDVERATGVSRNRLRPDLYPEPEKTVAA